MSTEAEIPQQGPSRQDLENALSAELLKQQDIVYAIVGGLAAAIIGALVWAIITVATKYQIGYMAIGVGLLVGFTVRFFGGGIEKYYGVIGAVFALFGCLLGNLLSQIGFAANEEGVGYFQIIGRINASVLIALFKETFTPMDLFFYAIAAYEGFRFGFRNVDEELEKSIAAGKIEPLPFSEFRVPVVIGLFICLAVIGYFVFNASDGGQQYKYESGALQASGSSSGGRENGPWEFWWENGQKQATGAYIDGKEEGEWVFYNEDGTVLTKGSYKSGMKEGEWIEYHPDGKENSKGQYTYGRLAGPWEYWYASGKLMSKGNYWLDKHDGDWEFYYENGKPISKGKYKEDEPIGMWTQWYEDGSKKSEIEYFENYSKILNMWDEHGKGNIVNGKGRLRVLDDEGHLLEEGMIEDGLRAGTWTVYFSDGKKKEIRDYKDTDYFLTTAWSPTGEEVVTKGRGYYDSFYVNGNKMESGKILDGRRVEIWKTFYTSSEVAGETTYKDGKLDGSSKGYDVSGFLSVEGNFLNGKREGSWKWYRGEGVMESEVKYINGKKEGDQTFFNTYGDLLRTEVYKDGALIATNLGGE